MNRRSSMNLKAANPTAMNATLSRQLNRPTASPKSHQHLQKRPTFWQRLAEHPVGQFCGQFFIWSAKAPYNLLVVLPDPWTGNGAVGRDIINQRFRFCGQDFSFSQHKWKPENANPDYVTMLHGFEWLRDLRAVGGDHARKTARLFVKDWIQHYKRWDGLAWRPDIVGTRLASWIGLHDFFLSSADDGYRLTVFEAMQKQSRYLARVLPGQTKGSRLITALKGQIYACLALPNSQPRLFQALTLLTDELNKQILPDGGHIERNPLTHAQTLRHLIDIRAALRCAGLVIPETLQSAIHQMAPILRFYCHGDGKLAQFNGSSEFDPALLNMIAQQAHAAGKVGTAAPHTGYERLQIGRSVVLFDVGTPPGPGYDAQVHAAPLSFEFSSGRERIVVNCGHAGAICRSMPLSMALRQTAAHSTATIAETNAIELRPEGGIGRHPKTIHLHHDATKDQVVVAASHDGYHSNLGVIHNRQLYLGDEGEDFRGNDSFVGSAGHPFVIRFHLHPSIKASLTGNNTGVLLRGRSGAGWRFRCIGASVALEESVYLENPDQPLQPTQQIILTGHTSDKETVLKWSFKREKKPRTTADEKKTAAAEKALADKNSSHSSQHTLLGDTPEFI